MFMVSIIFEINIVGVIIALNLLPPSSHHSLLPRFVGVFLFKVCAGFDLVGKLFRTISDLLRPLGI